MRTENQPSDPSEAARAAAPPDMPLAGIHRAVPAEARQTAARLYALAFDAKLRAALGAGDERLRFLADHLRPDRMLCATVDGRVRGVAGLHLDGGTAFDVTLPGLFRAYGVSAGWRFLVLLGLHREPRPDELLLDGIAVDPAARGQGLGTLLLREAEILAAERGLRRVRLSVVDTNPRARALYERVGFVTVHSERVDTLGRLYGGFTEVTDMVKEVPACPR
ncbi:GNAT family N-acetyltransferase [Actinoplanes utahensis]|nr:GNAT family N-acetyltransferase [Actinoplanes utahensis]GIF33654.1 molybdopterin-guanine dinucleotide biosynthesis protein MobC [Actinoplanes utahensis]